MRLACRRIADRGPNVGCGHDVDSVSLSHVIGLPKA